LGQLQIQIQEAFSSLIPSSLYTGRK
jgi:hypothetical protein